MIRRFLALTLFTLAAVLTHAQPSLPSPGCRDLTNNFAVSECHDQVTSTLR